MDRINMKVEIRRNSDGATASEVWPGWLFNFWWWTDGNASCDCNRELFYLCAKGEDDDVDSKCSEGKYSVRLSNADTGEVLYDEFDQR